MSLNWENEEGSTKEILGRVRKKGSGMIWLEKRGCVTERNGENKLMQKLSGNNGTGTHNHLVGKRAVWFDG